MALSSPALSPMFMTFFKLPTLYGVGTTICGVTLAYGPLDTGGCEVSSN